MLIDLLRHGSTGRSGYLDGRTDPALTDEGWAQVSAQTRSRSWAAVVSSPLQRAEAVATALTDGTRAPLRIDPDWAEYDFGDWDGLKRSEIEADPPGRTALAAFYADPIRHPAPGGATWASYETRVQRALLRVLSEAASPTLVITHAGPIRLALAFATGIERNSLWALRVAYGTRIRLNAAIGANGKSWAEIVEIVQPESAP